MPNQDYTQHDEQVSQQQTGQQGQQQAATGQAPDMGPLLATLTQVFATLQTQLQGQTPNPFQGTAAEDAVDVFNGIVAGLQLRPTPVAPEHVNAAASSPTEIKLGWEWSGRTDEADGFKIFRCQGQNCENFVEIEKKVSLNERNYIDRNLSSNETYRYVMSAFKFGRESAFSNIAQAKTS
jgi:hypothetical protein